MKLYLEPYHNLFLVALYSENGSIHCQKLFTTHKEAKAFYNKLNDEYKEKLVYQKELV
jgi:hypothetical protein